MTTQQTEQVQETPAPAEETEPVRLIGDEPLVAPDAAVEEPLVPPDEPEAKAPVEPDTSEPEARAEEEPEAPQEDEAPSLTPEVEALIAKQVKDAEARIQSGYGKRQREDSETIRRLTAARQEDTEERAVNERVEAHGKALQKWYTDQGIDPTEAASRIEKETENFRAATVGAQEKRTAASRDAMRERALGGAGLNSWVGKLATDHSLNAEDADVLKGYYDVENLPLLQDPQTGQVFLDEEAVARIGGRLFLMAERLGGVATATQEAQKTTEAAAKTVQERTPPVKLETTLGAPATSDDQFLANYANRDHPESDHKRALDIMARRGMSPI